MKNRIITLVALVAVLAAFDAQAFKKAANVRPAATSTTGEQVVNPASNVKTTGSVVKPVVTTDKPGSAAKVLSESEQLKKIELAQQLIAQSKKLYSDLADLAISFGNKQDAEKFYKSALDLLKAQSEEQDQLNSTKISGLQLRAKLPLTEKNKVSIKQSIDEQYKRGRVYRQDNATASQANVLKDINDQLDAAGIEHDDTYFNQYMDSLNWKN